MNNREISSAEEIFLSNMRTLNRESRELYEARVCELSLYAEALADELSPLLLDGLSLNEALCAIGRLDFHPASGDDDAFIDTASYFKTLSSFDRAEIARQLVFRLSRMGVSLSLYELYPTGTEGSRVCYVKNALSDEAYDVFSQESELSLGYVGSFDEAARAVRDGEYGYCILPLEESGGVRPRRIMNMLREMSLKIVAVTPVFGFDGSADMKYALVGQGICEPTLSGDDELYVDLLLSLEDGASLTGLLTGCEALGFLHTRSSQSVTPAGEALTSLVLKATREALIELTVFLTLFYEGFELIGLYKNLE